MLVLIAQLWGTIDTFLITEEVGNHGTEKSRHTAQLKHRLLMSFNLIMFD